MTQTKERVDLQELYAQTGQVRIAIGTFRSLQHIESVLKNIQDPKKKAEFEESLFERQGIMTEGRLERDLAQMKEKVKDSENYLDEMKTYLTMFVKEIQYATFPARVLMSKLTKDFLDNLADYDTATKMNRKRTMEKELSEEIERTKRYGHQLSLMMFDIDNFRRYNEAKGHPAGDEIISWLANSVKTFARKSIDKYYRYANGDEFAMMLPETGAEEARTVAKRINLDFYSHNEENREITIEKYPISVSAGIGSYRPGMEAPDMIYEADRALMDAKRSGKNKICLAKDISNLFIEEEAARVMGKNPISRTNFARR